MPRDPATSACVIFLGQTGLNKFARPEDPASRPTVDRKLASEVELLAAAEGEDPKSIWQAYALEEYLVPGSTLDVFLAADRDERQERWVAACADLAEEVDASSARTVGVFLHGSYWNEGDLSSHINLDALRSLNPTLVVTLIDDVFDVHSRIMRHADEAGPQPGFGIDKMQIPHVLMWRAAEVTAGDFIAENVRAGRRLPHIVFGVKHPPITLRRLLFERDRLPVYASFPISRTRELRPAIGAKQQRELAAEIDEFRRRLVDAGYAVLDPLAIDEIRFLPSGHEFPRWPEQSLGTDLLPMVPGEPDFHSRTNEQCASPVTRAAFIADIDDQVTPRDLRMIDAASAVAAYRPAAYDGLHSGGTFEELRYGRDRGIATVAVHFPARDGGEYRFSPTGRGTMSRGKKPQLRDSVERALQYLQGVQGSRLRQFGPGFEPGIWTDAAGGRLDRSRRKRLGNP